MRPTIRFVGPYRIPARVVSQDTPTNLLPTCENAAPLITPREREVPPDGLQSPVAPALALNVNETALDSLGPMVTLWLVVPYFSCQASMV